MTRDEAIKQIEAMNFSKDETKSLIDLIILLGFCEYMRGYDDGYDTCKKDFKQ